MDETVKIGDADRHNNPNEEPKSGEIEQKDEVLDENVTFSYPESDYDPDAYSIEDNKMIEIMKPFGEVGHFRKWQLNRIKVNPDELEIELTDEEKRYYFNEDNYQGMLKFRMATSADYQALRREIKESEGFDVPFLPWLRYHGTHRTNLTVAEDAIRIAQCAKCALKFYNKRNGSDFSLVRLVMSATKPCSGKIYRITFKAMSPSTGYTETFQTEAFIKWTGDLEIMIRIQNEYDRLRVAAQTGHVYKLSTLMQKKIDVLKSFC